METVNGFKFQMYIFNLLDASFNITADNGIIIFGFSDVFQDTFMAVLAGGDFDAAQV